MIPLAEKFSITLPNNVLLEITTDSADKAAQAAARYWKKTKGLTVDPSQFVATSGAAATPSIDTFSGAPSRVRTLVGGAPNQAARLATLRKFYPDAQIYGEDNFVFTDPETNQATLYNPPGLDAGDISSITPEIYEYGGGVLGGAAAAIPGVMAAPATLGGSLATIPVGVGLGAAAGRELENQIAMARGRVDPRALPERATDASLTAGINVAGQRAGEYAPQAVKALLGGGRAAQKKIYDAFQRSGVTPRAGAVTGSSAIQSAEQAVAITPGGSGIMSKAFNDTLDELGAASKRVAESFGRRMDKDELGRHVYRSVKDSFSRFKANSEQLYKKVYTGRLRPSTQVDVSPIINKLDSMVSDLAGSPKLSSRFMGEAQKLLDDFGEDASTLTFAGLRKIRTRIGDKLNDPFMVGDDTVGAYKQIYGALSEVLDDAVLKSGDDAAKAAWKRANTWYAKNRSNRIDFLNEIIRMGDPGGLSGPAKIADFLKASGTASASRLSRLRGSLLPEEWDAVVGSTLYEMGKARPSAQQAGEALMEAADEFSPATFITNWARLSSKTKKSLLGGTRYSEARGQLDDLVKISNELKNADKFRNYSNTARNVIWASLIGGAGVAEQTFSGGLSYTAAAIGGATIPPYLVAKLLTNPRFTRWMVNGMKRVTDKPASLNLHLTRLATIAKLEPEIREEIEQYRASIRAAPAIESAAQVARRTAATTPPLPIPARR